RDPISGSTLPTRANSSNTPVDGTLADRRRAPSCFQTPQEIAVSATVERAHRVHLSLLYQGASQPAYTYVIDGDANADRLGGGGALFNDIVYVPRDRSDITLRMADSTPAPPAEYARLQNFIAQQPCLEKQRGRIMGRNSCRNGWLGSVNARLGTTVALRGGRYLEITADIFNLPNRSEEHTSELQSRVDLVCRLLLEQ